MFDQYRSPADCVWTLAAALRSDPHSEQNQHDLADAMAFVAIERDSPKKSVAGLVRYYFSPGRWNPCPDETRRRVNAHALATLARLEAERLLAWHALALPAAMGDGNAKN